MKSVKIVLPVIFVLVLILASCATPPVDEMNKAQDAVSRAENDADAVIYAPNGLIRARDALTRMQSEVDSKRYDAAKNFAAEAVSNAEKAIADGKTGAERAREEAANLINGLQGPLNETSNAIDTAQHDNIPLDFDTLSKDIDLAYETYDNAQQNLETNNYMGAIANGQNVRSLLSEINTKITDTVQETLRKQ